MARVFSRRDKELRKQPARRRESRQNARQGAHVRQHAPAASKPAQAIVQRETPVAALQLNEDIQALKTAGKLVGSIDALNIMDTVTQGERDTAEELKRNAVSMLKNWQRYAESKLRRDYLAQ